MENNSSLNKKSNSKRRMLSIFEGLSLIIAISTVLIYYINESYDHSAKTERFIFLGFIPVIIFSSFF